MSWWWPYGCAGINHREICGEFETPTNEDTGRCHPYRVKIDCEAPVVPTPTCPNDEFTVVFDPDLTPPFRVTSLLMDENCEPVTDEDGNPIQVVTY